MLNEDQQAVVRSTYTIVARDADLAGRVFYERLFELEPSFRHMFDVKMTQQGHHFMLAMSAVVTSIAAPEIITPILRQLGKRHVQYGVRPEHFLVMKRALLDTLRHILGIDYTAVVESAWGTLYDWLVAIATEGLYTSTASK